MKISTLRQRTILAFQEAGILSPDGMLTEKAIKESEFIKSFDNLGNNIAKSKMLKINPDGDWWKCKTTSIKLFDKQPAEIHFYFDKKTGGVCLNNDFKIKVNNDIGVGVFKPITLKKGMKK